MNYNLGKGSSGGEKVLAIINRGASHGTLNGVIKTNREIMKFVAAKVKIGMAKLIIDTEDTLMYHVSVDNHFF